MYSTPIIIFIIEKIVKFKFLEKKIEKSRIASIFIYEILFIICLVFLKLLNPSINHIDNITYSYYSYCLYYYLVSWASFAMFIYEFYKYLDIKINKDLFNILLIVITVFIIVFVNIIQLVKLPIYINAYASTDNLLETVEIQDADYKKKILANEIKYRSVEELNPMVKSFCGCPLSVKCEYEYSKLINKATNEDGIKWGVARGKAYCNAAYRTLIINLLLALGVVDFSTFFGLRKRE